MVPEDKDSAYAVLCLLVDPIKKTQMATRLRKKRAAISAALSCWRYFSGAPPPGDDDGAVIGKH
jgi:hypothetical protein